MCFKLRFWSRAPSPSTFGCHQVPVGAGPCRVPRARIAHASGWMADRPPCTAATLISAPAKKLARSLVAGFSAGASGTAVRAFRSWDGPRPRLCLQFARMARTGHPRAAPPRTHLRWPLRGPSRTQPAPAPGSSNGPAQPLLPPTLSCSGTTERGLQMVHNDYASNVPPSFNTGVFLPAGFTRQAR